MSKTIKGKVEMEVAGKLPDIMNQNKTQVSAV